MSFTQVIEVNGVADEQALTALMQRWDREQADAAPGYQGARVLADTDNPGNYLVVVDFSSAEEAQRNNDRQETAAWAEQLRSVGGGDPGFRNLQERYVTSG